MKRLISWLLVLAMAIACLPMSAFAAVDIEDGDPDIDVGFEQLLPGYNAENPIDLTADLRPDFTATVNVPAGKTMYFIANNVGGMYMTINDGEAVECVAAPRQPYAWSITNDGAEDAEYVIVVAFPAGHEMNPVVIEDMTWYSSEVSQAAGDIDGFFYSYTAAETGTVTLYFDAQYDDEGNVIEGIVRDIMVTNQNTYAQYSLLQDGIDNYGLELQIPVEAGQQLIINTAAVEDANGNYYPEATYSWTGIFSYPAGHEQNPIDIEWAWDDAYANATASVTVPEGATQYFTGKAGMILTANGTEIIQEKGVFFLNAGTYELKLATPVGAYNNPEVIENIDGYTDSNSLEADANYNYVWTATEDGTVTLDITDGANITVNKVIEISEDGWPVTEQFELATVEYDDNWNASWVVAENLQIEVVAGQQLNIQVNGLTDWATWSVPAIDYTLTGAFEAAEQGPLVDEALKFQTRALSFQEEIVYQCVFNTGSVSGYDSFYVECTHYDPVDGEYTENLVAKKMGTRLQFKKNFLSWSMVDEIKITLYGVKGEDVYMGESFVTSVKAEALSIIEAKKSTDTKTCRVLVDMLNYGAEVQKAFNHNASNPANADLGEYASFATSEMPAYSAQTVRGTAGSVRVNSLGISMQSKVEYQLVLANSNENHELRAYVDGTLYSTVPYADFIVRGNFRQAKLAIKAADMRTVMQIAVYDKTTGEAVSETITTCAEAFATANIGEGKTYNDVFIAMLKYGDSVSALLG